MAHSQYERVSHFREGSMGEIDDPKLTPRSSYSTGLEKPIQPKETVYNYKPVILRTPSLLSLLVLTLALIGVLEYAISRLPHGELNLKKRDEIPYPPELARIIERRSESSTSSSSTTSVDSSATSPTAYISPSSSSTISTGEFTTPTAYVDETSSSITVLASTNRDAFVVEKSTSTSEGQVTAFTADTTAYVDEKSTSTSISTTTILADTAQSAYVPSEATETVETIPQHGLQKTSMPPTVASAPSSAYVSTATTAFITPLPGSSDDDNPDSTPPNGNDDESDSDHDANNEDDDDDADVENEDNSHFDTQNAAVDGSGDHSTFMVFKVWGVWQTFLGTYLAVCIAVLYRLLWIVVYNAFTLIEPFRQLMSREGALAERAFFSFYQSQSNLLGPLPALMKRRWTLALIGTAWMLVNLLPALAAESIYVETDWDCPNPNLNNTNNPCNPRMTGNPTVLRVMQGLLALAAVVLLFTTSLLLFNKTGLPTKPNSIATIASLMRHPQLVSDLNQIPVNASEKHMQRLLEGKRYRLGHYTCANGLSGYGIIPWNGHDSNGFVSPFGTFKHQYTPVDGSMPFSEREDSRPSRFQVKDFVLAFTVLEAFGVVLAYYLDGNDDGFNRFFNSNTFGPRFILTLAGTVIASVWKSVEQDAVVRSPYLRLHSRPSSPSSTILFNPTSIPLISTLRALRHRYFFTSIITILTLAAEGLNIVISGIPYANGQTLSQFFVSSYISLAILGVMIIVVALIIVRRFWEPKTPRSPRTVGAVMSYLCGSRMIDDFEGCEGLDERTRKERVRSWGKKYSFCERVRADGKLAWGVDEAWDARGRY